MKVIVVTCAILIHLFEDLCNILTLSRCLDFFPEFAFSAVCGPTFKTLVFQQVLSAVICRQALAQRRAVNSRSRSSCSGCNKGEHQSCPKLHDKEDSRPKQQRYRRQGIFIVGCPPTSYVLLPPIDIFLIRISVITFITFWILGLIR